MEAHKPALVTRVGNGQVIEERTESTELRTHGARRAPAASPRQSPEKQFFGRMRGHKVQVCMLDGEMLKGTISWVDKYTFGLVEQETGETLYYKHGVRFIRPVR